MNHLPYSEIFTDLLLQIHKALGHCYTLYKKQGYILESDKKLSSFYSQFEARYRQSGLNKHLTKGLTKSEQKKFKIYPRLSKLTIQAFLSVQESKKNKNYKAKVLPSPFKILYHALTVPSEPQTAAYPLVLCRSMMFYFLRIHPKHSHLEYVTTRFETFREEEVLNSLSSFKNHIRIQARWPDPRINPSSTTSRINFLIGHFLGLKGITHLWFNTEKELLIFCNLSTKNDLEHLQILYSKPKYNFRMSESISDLPDSAEIINWIFGLPLPLRGADILLQGGLKKSASSGLVISIHGQPGTGKTSAALSFSAVLSPFRTTTIYLSLEEEKEDLETRLHTLIPEYLKELSIYQPVKNQSRRKLVEAQTLSWFRPFKINSNLTVAELTDILKLLKGDIRKKQQEFLDADPKPDFDIPAVCPLLIVIDNINEMFADKVFGSESYEKLEKFIVQCRNMDALVILIAADDIPSKIKLDYLVDVSLHLKQIGIDKHNEKTTRIVQLIKTRHQVSRQGAHVFHLSNSKGFRISPQVPSQMDKREKIKRLLPSDTEFIHTLNIVQQKNKLEVYDYLPIAARSQILIHGFGSSGKAGFGLKLLLNPLLKEKPLVNRNSRIVYDPNSLQKNKVLIVSFLYPEEYYEILFQKIRKQFHSLFDNYDPSCSLYTVKAFYPGYLTPEDFVFKIARLLDEANLEGEPYTGILLDGLHNVFLQFKNLQESHMIWPLLYSILSRYNLTVVTTFTNFSLTERHTNNELVDQRHQFQNPDDYALMQQGQKPFLHGLVKAADYYLVLEEVIDDTNNFEKKYWLSVRSSIRQTPPKEFAEWDRQGLNLRRIIPSKEVYNNIQETTDDLNLLQARVVKLESAIRFLSS